MKLLTQTIALIGFNLRTLPARAGSAAAAIFGIAGVVAVLVGVLSIGEGFRRTMTVAGSPDTVFVLRTGADSEMASILSREEARVIAEAPGVRVRTAKRSSRPSSSSSSISPSAPPEPTPTFRCAAWSRRHLPCARK